MICQGSLELQSSLLFQRMAHLAFLCIHSFPSFIKNHHCLLHFRKAIVLDKILSTSIIISHAPNQDSHHHDGLAWMVSLPFSAIALWLVAVDSKLNTSFCFCCCLCFLLPAGLFTDLCYYLFAFSLCILEHLINFFEQGLVLSWKFWYIPVCCWSGLLTRTLAHFHHQQTKSWQDQFMLQQLNHHAGGADNPCLAFDCH